MPLPQSLLSICEDIDNGIHRRSGGSILTPQAVEYNFTRSLPRDTSFIVEEPIKSMFQAHGIIKL